METMGGTRETKVTVFYLFSNVVCSIVIVLLNKWVYVHVGFPNITLSLLHFAVTFVGLYFCQQWNMFQVKSVGLKDMLPLALTFCGFVVFTNLSLQHNTVGTFQLAKFMTTPCVIMIQMFLYNKQFSLLVKLTLVPIVLGVFLNFCYDLQFSILGTLYATLGVLVTSFYQVLVSQKQHELQMDSMQLLYYQAPLSAFMLLLIVPILEPIHSTILHDWTIMDLMMIGASCIIAFFVNISIYWIIGNTSPLTYNMVGHLKFCMTVLGGVLIFEDSLHINQGIGVLLTVMGITAYAHVKIKEHKPPVRSLENGCEILIRKI